MKRLITILLSAAMLLSLMACSKTETKPEPTADPEPVVEPEEPDVQPEPEWMSIL